MSSCETAAVTARSMRKLMFGHDILRGRNPNPLAIECRDLECHVNEECLLTVVECDFHYTSCEARLHHKYMAIATTSSHHTKALSLIHPSWPLMPGRQPSRLMQRALEVLRAEMKFKSLKKRTITKKENWLALSPLYSSHYLYND